LFRRDEALPVKNIVVPTPIVSAAPAYFVGGACCRAAVYFCGGPKDAFSPLTVPRNFLYFRAGRAEDDSGVIDTPDADF
jgi:hypothetical protein